MYIEPCYLPAAVADLFSPVACFRAPCQAVSDLPVRLGRFLLLDPERRRQAPPARALSPPPVLTTEAPGGAALRQQPAATEAPAPAGSAPDGKPKRKPAHGRSVSLDFDVLHDMAAQLQREQRARSPSVRQGGLSPFEEDDGEGGTTAKDTAAALALSPRGSPRGSTSGRPSQQPPTGAGAHGRDRLGPRGRRGGDQRDRLDLVNPER